MNTFEHIDADMKAANEQLHGFTISGTQEQMQQAYKGLFEGIESGSLETLFQEFREIIANAPSEIMEEIKQGDTHALAEHALHHGWAQNKIKQLIIYALIGISASQASAAFAGGKEQMLHDLDSVHLHVAQSQDLSDQRNRTAGLHMPRKVQIRGEHMVITPVISQSSGVRAHMADTSVVLPQKDRVQSRLVSVDNGAQVIDSIKRDTVSDKRSVAINGQFMLNGHPAKVIYNDGHRVVFGDENSIYKNDGNGEVAVGVIIVE